MLRKVLIRKALCADNNALIVQRNNVLQRRVKRICFASVFSELDVRIRLKKTYDKVTVLTITHGEKQLLMDILNLDIINGHFNNYAVCAFLRVDMLFHLLCLCQDQATSAQTDALGRANTHTITKKS